jgi:hypothetical protein
MNSTLAQRHEQDAPTAAVAHGITDAATSAIPGTLPHTPEAGTSEVLQCLSLAAWQGCHFTPDQVWRLLAVRHRWQAGCGGELDEPCGDGGDGDGDDAPAVPDARWQFAKWLYAHGRLSG